MIKALLKQTGEKMRLDWNSLTFQEASEALSLLNKKIDKGE